MQDGFLHVHAIFGLVEDDGLRAVENFRRDFEAAVRRKTVHEDGVGSGESHEFGVDLIRLEDGVAGFFFSFEAHAGPGIGVHSLRAGDGFAWIGEEFDLGLGFAGDALGIGDDFGKRGVVGRRGDAEVHAETRGQIDERVADVVAIADVRELEAAKIAESFGEREIVGECLARMEFIRERVDDRNVRVSRQIFENFLLVDAGNDALDPAVEIAGDIGDGFACAEAGLGLGVVEKDDVAAHALNAHVECDASAKGRLFENEGDEFSGERGSVADRASFDVGGELQEIACMRGAPFGAGEEIVGK